MGLEAAETEVVLEEEGEPEDGGGQEKGVADSAAREKLRSEIDGKFEPK